MMAEGPEERGEGVGWRLPPGFADDLLLTVVTGVVAGCGLVYEYLLSHYAGRVLGSVETVIYAIIGLMIVSMGLGSFAARLVRCPFTGFAWLESIIAVLGAGAVVLLAAIFAFAHTFPRVIAETFGLPGDVIPHGGFLLQLQDVAKAMPYAMSILLGFLVGMEIPLLARVREQVHGRHLEHNTGMIYGADYLGAGVGAALWVGFMLALESAFSAVLTASVNLAVGLLFLFRYQGRIRGVGPLAFLQLVSVLLLLILYQNGQGWNRAFENALFRDEVIFSANTSFQRLTVTRREKGVHSLYTLFINGRTQFTSNDEHIYHAMLVAPAMAASNRQEKILIIGGGDGLALRNVLRWDPKRVVMLELDPRMIDFFSRPRPDGVNLPLLRLNENALNDPRVMIRYGDAFLTVDELLDGGERFDVILVDLPDPGHPDINKLYTDHFYAKLKALLVGDGAMAVQSTSPYHARKAFLCVGVTMAHAGFAFVERYHANVPSFGEWGWTIGTLAGAPASTRLARLHDPALHDPWATPGMLLAAFQFPARFFADMGQIEVNHLGSGRMYQYHHQAWLADRGLHIPQFDKNLEGNED